MAPSPHNEEVNVEDVNDETVQTQTTRRRKRRKPAPVFDESGLTKQQRRDTRMQQRMLHEDLETTTAPEQLEEIAIRNNDIFKNEVRYSREAVLDADNVFLLTQKYEQYAETLVQVPRFDSSKLVQKLRSKCSSAHGQFNWILLGKEAGICFNALPDQVTFLCGPLDAAPVSKKKQERKERRKQKDDDVEVVKPEQVKEGEQEGDPNKLSATEKTIKSMERTLKKKVKESSDLGKGLEIDGAKFLCNPNSFTQTVENIFHFSFLIKKGGAKIGIRKSAGLGERSKRGLYVSSAAPNKDSDSTAPPNKQSVMTFTMRDWRAMCKGMKEGDLPNRDSTLPACMAGFSQL